MGLASGIYSCQTFYISLKKKKQPTDSESLPSDQKFCIHHLQVLLLKVDYLPVPSVLARAFVVHLDTGIHNMYDNSSSPCGEESLLLSIDAILGISGDVSLPLSNSVFISFPLSPPLGNHGTKNCQILHLFLNQQAIY